MLVIVGLLTVIAFVVVILEFTPTSDEEEVRNQNPLPPMYKTGGEWYDGH